ncbi:MAG: exodeoxyribonuclease V subunit alpha [Bacilli bacterium]|nr:exodeoxyribonuclease V subunit alpha [Bacilli bacterium]
MGIKSFYRLLLDNSLISAVWEGVLDILASEINESVLKKQYLNLFAIYFSLIDDGNICMSLDSNVLNEKWGKKTSSTEILLKAKEAFNEDEMSEIKKISNVAISTALNEISEKNIPTLIGENKLFTISEGWLYARKYDIARKSVIASIDRLFSRVPDGLKPIDYKSFVVENFSLSAGQEEAVKKGMNNSLIITGGPGTGKTTSILFLLMGLLSARPNSLIHLVAPSGKASSRMKESIINGLSSIRKEYLSNPANEEIITKIKNLEESTIHRLLEINPSTNSFRFNKDHQFAENSIFVVDEASMIDICLFSDLLEAIPDNSLIYIMGDKNQLPSVECGAVFADLLAKESIHNCVIELDESRRFGQETKIYELAEAINHGEELPVSGKDWVSFDKFEVTDVIKDPITNKKTCPIFYYSCDHETATQRQIIQYIVYAWGKEFYSTLQERCTGVDLSKGTDVLDAIFKYSEESKILCAENEGDRGVKTINRFIKSNFINKRAVSSVLNYFPGEIMMINKNNKSMDLYNGDSGILISFKGDKTLYFMVKKASAIISEDGKKEDKIFKIGHFVFYPLRLISISEIDEAYAISIHKSQGSDYNQILCILPTSKGHPLLNRQIVYTAITRTKGNTYILSNQERLEEARDTVTKRDTNID